MCIRDSGTITWAAVVVTILGTFAHEFGHAAACAKAGGRCGEIGWGIYWYFPVLYNRLDDAWRLPRLERARIDGAGVFLQIAFTVVVCAIAIAIPGGSAALSGLPLLLFA